MRTIIEKNGMFAVVHPLQSEPPSQLSTNSPSQLPTLLRKLGVQV